MILSVTSSGDCIDPAWLQPGSVVLDVAVPADVKRTARPRTDVLVLSGGYARMPDPMPHTSAMVSFFQGIIPSCLAETTTLALEQRPECFTLGRELALERVQEIGALAEKHGFELAPLLSYGLAIEDSVLVEFRKVVGRRRRTSRLRPSAPAGQMNGVVSADTGTGASGLPPLSELACRAAMLHGRHLNPVLIALSGNSGLTKTFLRGSGALLHDQEGRSYLDFVSGFGSMNLGHNHPAVVEAVQSALIQQAPGFAQASVNPLAAALAEELVTLAPAGLELVFFTNSGAESVEAALKLARTVTARPGLLSCIGSFHGKTLGALSVTGNPRYQQPFGSLLPDCGAIPFGDLAALEQALRTYHYAAFIVEPIQGEGGMIVPPPGYLAQAQELCRATGSLLIVDEIQTGLGRTGTLFAIESEGVEPDVLTLAKSLGGGLVPIGAMLTRRDLWMKAYGSYQSFLLHTSTFGGGSLACAAGLATLRVLSSSDLIENARQRGEQLLQGLTALCQRSSKLHEVRGRGLMLGLEFTPPSPALKHHFQRTGGSNAAWALIPNYPELVASLPSVYIMSTLLQEHGIYTQVARSNPLVLRIQPPLIITQSQVDRFLEALEQTCSELDYFSQALNTILAKSIGEHEPI